MFRPIKDLYQGDLFTERCLSVNKEITIYIYIYISTYFVVIQNILSEVHGGLMVAYVSNCSLWDLPRMVQENHRKEFTQLIIEKRIEFVTF
jgi:hypothetical protein